MLFSPIAHEDLRQSRICPTASENNQRLALYTKAMAEVASGAQRARSSICSRRRCELYAASTAPLTIQGIHLNTEGNRRIAADHRPRALRRRAEATSRAAADERSAQAVVDKDFYWFNRYRTTDGFATFGDRAFLTFVAAIRATSTRQTAKAARRRAADQLRVLQREIECST